MISQWKEAPRNTGRRFLKYAAAATTMAGLALGMQAPFAASASDAKADALPRAASAPVQLPKAAAVPVLVPRVRAKAMDGVPMVPEHAPHRGPFPGGPGG